MVRLSQRYGDARHVNELTESSIGLSACLLNTRAFPAGASLLWQEDRGRGPWWWEEPGGFFLGRCRCWAQPGVGMWCQNKSPANARSSLGLAFVESSIGTLRVPGTARRSSQSPLKEVNPEYPLEGLTLKLKLQYFGHLMWRANSLEKTLMLGKIEGRRRRGR